MYDVCKHFLSLAVTVCIDAMLKEITTKSDRCQFTLTFINPCQIQPGNPTICYVIFIDGLVKNAISSAIIFHKFN